MGFWPVRRDPREHRKILDHTYGVPWAADEFRDKTKRPNQLRQIDFTYLKVIGWGWFCLSAILDDDSRNIIAWKLCTTMKAGDVTDTLDLALQASGCDRATVLHKPRLLSDVPSRYARKSVTPNQAAPLARCSCGMQLLDKGLNLGAGT